MPKIHTSIFSYPRDNPSAMPKTTTTPSFFSFLPYGRSNSEDPNQNATDELIANPFTSAIQRYVPRPLRHQEQRPATLVHPLAATEQDPSQVLAPPISDALMEQDRAPDTHSQIIPVSDAPMEQDPNSVQDIHTEPAAIKQDQAPDTHSQIVEPPVSDAPMEQGQNPAQNFVFPNTPIRDLRKTHLLPKRRYDNSRTITRRDTAPRAVTEKTRLVEQLDMTTRKIMDHKDNTISELEAQV